MEEASAGIDVATLERVAGETSGVRDVHDLHVWSIVEDAPIVTAQRRTCAWRVRCRVARNVAADWRKRAAGRT